MKDQFLKQTAAYLAQIRKDIQEAQDHLASLRRLEKSLVGLLEDFNPGENPRPSSDRASLMVAVMKEAGRPMSLAEIAKKARAKDPHSTVTLQAWKQSLYRIMRLAPDRFTNVHHGFWALTNGDLAAQGPQGESMP